MTDLTKPKLYLKHTCPFCLKVRIFLTEANLSDQVEFVVFTDGDDTHQALRQRMEANGVKPAFPALEVATNQFKTGTDDLIAKFARDNDVNVESLPLLTYYSTGVFKRMGELFMENRKLKGEG